MAATVAPAGRVSVAHRLRVTCAPVLLGASAAVIVGAAVIAGGGSGDRMVSWLGIAALAVLAVAGALVLAGRLQLAALEPTGALAIAAFAGLAAWSGLSIVWSLDAERSFAYFNRGVAYLVLLCLGAALAAVLPRTQERVAWLALALLAIVVSWALAGKIAPALFEDGAGFARLREPIGFWNALGAVLAIGVPLPLWVAADRDRRPALRAAGVVLLLLVVVGLLLTLSRSGIALGALAIVAWLVLAPRRHASLVAAALAVGVGAAVGAWGLGARGITGDFVEYETRVDHGRTFGLILAGGVALVGLAAYAACRIEMRPGFLERHERRLRRGSQLALCLCALALVVALTVRTGNPFAWAADKAREFAASDYIDSSAERIESVSLNSRVPWWKESVTAFLEQPLGGTGAGTFELTHRRLRDAWQDVTEPHNVALQFLTETGIVGGLLYVAALVLLVAGAVRATRRLEPSDRPAALAISIGVVVWIVHGFVDVDWDFIAVNAMPLLAAGVLLGVARPLRRVRAPALSPLPVAGAILCICALLAPLVAGHRLDKSAAALDRGDAAAALRHAIDAEGANALSIAPLEARANALYALGDLDGVQAALLEAVRRAPDHPATWRALGQFQLDDAGRPALAVRLLERSWLLDPRGPLDPSREGESDLERARRLAGLPPLVVAAPG